MQLEEPIAPLLAFVFKEGGSGAFVIYTMTSLPFLL